MPSAYRQSAGAYYSIAAQDFRDDPNLISLHWAREESGSEGATPSTLRQLVSGGPSATAPSGKEVTLKTVAGGADVAHYLTGASSYYDAPDAAAYNWLHQRRTGYGFSFGPIWTMMLLVNIPTSFSGTLTLLETNNGSSSNPGMYLLIDRTGGVTTMTATVTTGGGAGTGLALTPATAGAIWSNPHVIIPGRWTLLTLEVSWGQAANGYDGRAWVHGIPVHRGRGEVWTNLSSHAASGTPSTSASNNALRFFNDQSAASGIAGAKIAMMALWGCVLSDEQRMAYSRYITETEDIDPIATVWYDEQAYTDQPSALIAADGELIVTCQKKRHNVDWQYQQNIIRRSRDYVGLSREEIMGRYGATGLGSGVGTALITEIDGVLWNATYDANSPLEVTDGATYTTHTFVQSSTDQGRTWTTPTYISKTVAGFTADQMCTEGPLVKAADGNLYIAVYDASASEGSKLLTSTDGGATWTADDTISASGVESWPLIVGNDLVIYYRKTTFNVYCRYKTWNGSTWSALSTEQLVVTTSNGGRPTAMLTQAGGIVLCMRGPSSEQHRLWLAYVSPANVTAQAYHTTGGIMRPDPTYGGYNGAMIVEPTAGHLRMTHGTELSGLGSQECRIHDGIWLTESLIAST